MPRFVAALTIMYVGSQAFDSVIRWVLNMVHADSAIYLRDVDLIGVIVLCLLLIIQSGRDVTRTVLLFVVFAGLCCVSLCSGLGAAQTLFGIKIWLPFIAGALLVESGVARHLDLPRLWSIVWLAVCAGILANYFFTYPWSGLLVDVGDVAISANREWTAGGIRRLSGFSRSSFDGAVIVLLLFTYLLIRWQGGLSRICLVGISAVAIALTTAKGAVAALLFSLALAPLLRLVRSSSSALKWPLLGSLLLVSAMGLLVPLLSEQFPFPRLQPGSVSNWVFASFVERAETTWPRAFDLLSSQWQWVTGRGLGGIGVSQLRFERNVYSPADNFFLYLFITAGSFGALFYAFLSLATVRLQLQISHHRMAFLFVCSCIVYGLTTNLVEIASFLMALGAVSSFLAAQGRLPVLAGERYGHSPAAARQLARAP
jgi:hypothetical protein